MAIIIQKFGGTSLKNLDIKNNPLNHIKRCIDEGNIPVIVVSAMGRYGDPYATDTLISQLAKLKSNINPKKKDLIMSCGETISATVVAHLLDIQDIPSEALTGFQAGILTDNNFNSSEIIDINTLPIKKYIKEGKIVVVAGFQGITKNKEITTLGRGGSDTTAVTLGGYLGAKRVDIFTDVQGVAIIDPVVVPYTKYIKNISYDNMYNLSSNGVKVIHPKAVLLGKKFNIPIRITSTHSDLKGTLISNTSEVERIIGIAIKHKDDYKVFSIFFNKKYEEDIKKDLEEFSKNNKKNILDILFYKDKISILVETDNLTQFAQNLYDCLLKWRPK